MIKGLLIDFGGTIDSDGIHWFNAFQEGYAVAADIPQDMLREAYVYTERTLGRNQIITPDYTFCKTLQTKIVLQTQYLNSKGILFTKHDTVLDYCYNKVVKHISEISKPVLERLHSRYPMVLVTNFYGNMHTVLDEFGLSHLFRDVVESSVVGVRKPDPEIFRLGVAALGLEPAETVMIGDSPDKDIIPAQSIGCHTIMLQGKSWSGMDCTPDQTVSTLSELTF
jgi:putative hydrolase of the HAD superfamily